MTPEEEQDQLRRIALAPGRLVAAARRLLKAADSYTPAKSYAEYWAALEELREALKE
jgi:hypothetical protein